MNWSDRALVLGGRPHGETGVILELMTQERGRHLGLVHGGRSRRLRAVLQPGNTVLATWRARLDEQLGSYTIEGERLRAARLIGSPLALFGVATLAAHLRLLAERDPHSDLFGAAETLVEHLDHAASAPGLFARFELMLLAELGFGLDLASCAASGASRDLVYVSPRSGRAVSRQAGEPYRARLLALPAFLTGEDPRHVPDLAEVTAALRLTGHFLGAHVYGPRGILQPEERTRFIALVTGGRQRDDPAKLDARGADTTDSVLDDQT